MKKRTKQLTQRQQQAFSYLSKDELAFSEIVGLLRDEVAHDRFRYEQAKEQLVMTGEGRPVCLRLAGRIEALQGVIDLLNSSREF